MKYSHKYMDDSGRNFIISDSVPTRLLIRLSFVNRLAHLHFLKLFVSSELVQREERSILVGGESA